MVITFSYIKNAYLNISRPLIKLIKINNEELRIFFFVLISNIPGYFSLKCITMYNWTYRICYEINWTEIHCKKLCICRCVCD